MSECKSKVSHTTSKRKQILKNEFLKNGIDNLSNREIIELVLSFSAKQNEPNKTSQELLERFGSISAIMDSPENFLTDAGLNENSAVLFKLIPSLARVYFSDKFMIDEKEINEKNIFKFLHYTFLGRTSECIYLMLFDCDKNLVYSDMIFHGTLYSNNMPVKKIMDLCSRYKAKAVLVAHNHPKGSAIPSRADLIATSDLIKALKIADIRFLDHIIVSEDDSISLEHSLYKKSVYFTMD